VINRVREQLSEQLLGSGRADRNLLLVASYVFWDSQLPLVHWRADSTVVVSSEQKVSEQTRPTSDFVPKFEFS